MQKVKDLELLRGGGILLVVFVHIIFNHNITILQYFAVFFCMPLFFSISGFLYGYKDISRLNCWENRKQYLRKKIISLGIPYILFSIIYIILNSWLSRYVDTNNSYEIHNVFLILYSPVAQYWYIWTLLVFFFISVSFLRLENYKIIFLISTILNAIWYFFYSDTDLTVYSKTIVWYMYFVGAAYLGQIYATNNYFIFLKKKKTQVYLFFLEIFFVATSFLRFSKYGVAGGLTMVLQLVNTVCGILGFWFVLYNVSRIKKIEKAIIIIAEYSWYIYILHSYFTALSKTILLRVFPDIDIYMYFVCSMVFTVTACIIVGYISQKIILIDFMFYPQKYLGKISR